MSERDAPFSPAIDARSSMQRRGAGRPRTFETARDPRRALARLLPYLRPYAPSLLVVAALVLCYSLLSLAGPYLLGRAIDQFISRRDVAGLLRTAILMLAAYAAANLFQLAANWFIARVSQLALKELRSDLFAHLQTLPMAFFDRNSAGSLCGQK